MADHWRVTGDKRRGGKSKGNLSENRGAEIGRKGVIFGGFGREKRGQKGVFRAPKAGKKALFCVPEG